MNLRKEPISLESVKCTAYDTASVKCTVVMIMEPKYVKRYVTGGAIKKSYGKTYTKIHLIKVLNKSPSRFVFLNYFLYMPFLHYLNDEYYISSNMK